MVTHPKYLIQSDIYLWNQMLSWWQVHVLQNYLSSHIILLVTQFSCWVNQIMFAEMILCSVCLCHFHQFTVTVVSCKILESCSFFASRSLFWIQCQQFVMASRDWCSPESIAKTLLQGLEYLLSRRKISAPSFCLLLVCDVGQFCTNEGLMFPTLIHQGFGGQK